MAFTTSHLVVGGSVFGNKRVKFLRVTADGAEGTTDTGLSFVESIMGYSPQSATSAPKFRLNAGSTSTALNGFIGCSGMVSGDVIFLTVVGK